MQRSAKQCKAVVKFSPFVKLIMIDLPSLMTHLATLPVTLTQYEATWPGEAAQLTASDLDGIARSEAWLSDGFAYFMEHATKVGSVQVNPIFPRCIYQSCFSLQLLG